MALPLRSDQRVRRTPWVTWALLGANIVVFLFLQPSGFQRGDLGRPVSQEQIWSVRDTEEFAYRWGAVPCEVTTGHLVVTSPRGCDGPRGDWLPRSKSIALALLTCMFLHGSVLHLAGNMIFLWVFGRSVEDRLGPATYLALYLLGGMVATLGFVAANGTVATPLLGASGAVAVVMGASLVLFPRARVLTVIATVAFQVVYVPAAVVLLLFFVTQFFTADDNVAWEAHAVGMVAGAIGALVLSRVPAVARRAAEDAADADLRLGADF